MNITKYIDKTPKGQKYQPFGAFFVKQLISIYLECRYFIEHTIPAEDSNSTVKNKAMFKKFGIDEKYIDKSIG